MTLGRSLGTPRAKTMFTRHNSNSADVQSAIDPRTFGLVKAAYSVKETLELLSIGRTMFYELVDREDLKITKLGRKTLVYAVDLAALLSKLRARN
jgi:excisionase family DNA binding protein